ncbi:hypothetical protein QAD02_009136 [Eretmocerus hayati]|uniref:Uncharacterized protein n=1 Tax=Eretmocerus hayati TaxID=131215 RepID=A0ACC2N9P8_9HYME|nr:hypothetical protein QAD02_009136 [Eretmocerus hayati]
MHMAFEELARLYGPVVGLKLGKQKLVLISSHDLVKKALLNDDLNGRPNGFFFRVRSFGKEKGVLFAGGPCWSQLRRFTVRHLRSFGFGQEVMGQRMEYEARCLIDLLKKQAEQGPVPMHNAFEVAVLNSLWWMIASKRFEPDDAKLKEILFVVHEVFRLNDTVGGVLSHLPLLRFVLPELSGYNELISMLRRFWKFFDDEIADHEHTLDQQQQQLPRDLIDAFLIEMRQGSRGSGSETIFDRENLLILSLDLFLAGTKTTTDTLGTMIAFLTLNPKWKEELQYELDNVVGRDRSPVLADIPFLPKIEAFIAESQRYLLLSPLAIPHRAMKDVLLEGYVIPKDTTIVLNFHSVHTDDHHWDNPEEFRPERFLDESGRYQHNNSSIPFGLGKRRCLGEGLARWSLFLLLTHVLHHFDFQSSDGSPSPEILGQDGFTISPRPYYLTLKVRD